MDNPEEFRSIELCAGYAGIHLGLKRVIRNLRTVAFVEIEAFACANLVAKMEAGHLDAAPIWTDLKTFNAEPFRDRIHIITGGYPCQPFSTAGKRQGKDDPRHLWPYIREIVKTVRPVFCFFENVEGHLSLGFKEVQQSLRSLGYTVEGGIFSAAECGAPQQRKRLFILAYSGCFGGELPRAQRTKKSYWDDEKGLGNSESDNKRGLSEQIIYRKGITDRRSSSWPSRPGQPQYEWEPPRVMANSVSVRKSQPERRKRNERGWPVNGCEILADTNSWLRAKQPWSNKWTISRINGESRGAGRKVKFEVGGDIDGCQDRLDNAKLYESCDNRTDELRLLGNGVIPDVAEKAFVTLYDKIMVGINATT